MAAIPNSNTPIQQGGAQSTLPVSESLMFAIGGAVNYCLTNAGQVGDVVMSDLSLAAFQSQRDTTWILSDGGTCVGTVYATLTGRTNVPDRRGTYPRAPDAGRGLDPNGAHVPGDYVVDQFKSHTHTTNAYTGGIVGVSSGGGEFGWDGSQVAGTITATGGTETAPKTTYANFFVKVNP